MIQINKFQPIKIAYFVVIAYTLILFSQMLYKHYLIINHPYQLEYREVANLLDTKALMEGENPYSLEHQPNLGTCYGIGYSAVCMPFAKIFGLNLFSHRLVSILSILLTSVLFFGMLKKEKIDTWMAFAGSVILYFNLSFNCQAICRPDALGMFFFSISVFVPIFYKYSAKSLIIALVFSIFSFYVKQYYIIGFGIVLIYVFLFESMKKALIYGVIYGLAFIVSVFVIRHFFESYFYSTILAMYSLAVNDVNYALYQFRVFFTVHLALTFMLILSIIIYTISNSAKLSSFLSSYNFTANLERYFNLKFFNKGLLNLRMNIYMFLFLVITFLLLVKLGGNDGALLTYYFQLLSFSFIIIVLKFSVIYPNSKVIFIPIIFLSLYISYAADETSYINEKEIENWKKISRIIKQSKDILNTPAISYELLLQKKKIYDTGLNSHWIHYVCDPNTFPGKMVQQTKDNIQEIQSKIKNKKFDVLILDAESKWTHSDWYANDSLIELYYIKTDSTDLKMFQTNQYWPVYIWRPKK